MNEENHAVPHARTFGLLVATLLSLAAWCVVVAVVVALMR